MAHRLRLFDTIRVLNQLIEERLVTKYCIGGAVGATFYIEPSSTLDVDIFIHLDPAPGGFLVSLDPIHNRLQELGYNQWEEDKLVVEGWPVQFIPVAKPLEIEALAEACAQTLERRAPAGSPEGAPDEKAETFVATPEHLMAIALDVHRPKDKLRLFQFYQEKKYDAEKLTDILTRHKLIEKWKALATFLKNRDPLAGE